MKVGIIGAGAWGGALAASASRAGNEVVLWSYDAVDAGISGNISVTNDMSQIRDATVWLIATPALFFRETIIKAKIFYTGQPVIICTKGMCPDGKFVGDILVEKLKIDKETLIGILSGPQFASEVAVGKPNGGIIAGSEKIYSVAKKALSGMILEESRDIMGVQICGAGKNAVAILMGYLDGKDVGENERALRLTKAWGEIVSLGRHMGAQIETFLGLAGLGDLFLTATSKTSRNYRAGLELAFGRKSIDTVEGISAVYGLSKMAANIRCGGDGAKKAGVFMPNMEFLAKLIAACDGAGD
ncbi:MAG: hypothetical protein FWG80_04310 [Alphaproteobacteria bacterium]|nr:hypothetical protein [Alphaproteobacteria bacterium]